MNFEKVRRKNRKAISPVLATVILIAITLIAAVAIAGFVFGLFGSFTSTAQVQANSPSCTKIALSVCTIQMSNTGSASTSVGAGTVLTLVFGGVRDTGTCAAATLTAGAVTTVTCTVVGGVTVPTAGEAFTGSVVLANGGSAAFSGIF